MQETAPTLEGQLPELKLNRPFVRSSNNLGSNIAIEVIPSSTSLEKDEQQISALNIKETTPNYRSKMADSRCYIPPFLTDHSTEKPK